MNKKISLSQEGFTPTDIFGEAVKKTTAFSDPNSGFIGFGIMLNNKNIGNILVWKLDKKTYQIDTIYIKKLYRNKGYGSLALKEVLNKYKDINFCLSGVKEAKTFYERNGFKVICFRKDTNCYDFELTRQKERSR